MADGAFGAPSASGGQATICYGVYVESNNLAGKSVSDIRKNYARMWNIPSDAVAYKGKTAMGEDYVVQEGDTIEFFRKAGEKG